MALIGFTVKRVIQNRAFSIIVLVSVGRVPEGRG